MSLRTIRLFLDIFVESPVPNKTPSSCATDKNLWIISCFQETKKIMKGNILDKKVWQEYYSKNSSVGMVFGLSWFDFFTVNVFSYWVQAKMWATHVHSLVAHEVQWPNFVYLYMTFLSLNLWGEGKKQQQHQHGTQKMTMRACMNFYAKLGQV